MSATVIVETLRRHFAHVAYVAALLLGMVLAAIIGAVGGDAGVLQAGMNLAMILAGCQIIGPEFSSGTLQLILAKPIHRATYLMSRVAGVVLALWIALAVLYATDVIARALAGHRIEWGDGGSSALAIAAEVVLVCSLMAFFGSFSRSYLNVALYLGIHVVLSLLQAGLQVIARLENGALAALGDLLRAHPGIISTISTIGGNLYPDPPLIPFDRNWFLMMASNSAVALLLACLIFRKREVPYGAD